MIDPREPDYAFYAGFTFASRLPFMPKMIQVGCRAFPSSRHSSMSDPFS